LLNVWGLNFNNKALPIKEWNICGQSLMQTNQQFKRNEPDLTVKVKLSLCLTKHHAIKAYWGVEVQLHAFFDFGSFGQLHAPAALTPGKGPLVPIR
jgi:hypothetical protein